MSNASQVAFVTGAGSGIGQAAARAFLLRGYGVALVDRDLELGQQTEAELGKLGDCTFIACDVSDETSVDHAVEAAVARYGRIDAAFNGAGINGDPGPIAEASSENWDRVMNVNLKGMMFCMKYQIRQMLGQGGGAIVNCASSAGLVGVAGLSTYAASKHGVVGLTRSAALEYVRSNIRINAVCPGMIDTPMWRRSISPELTEELLSKDPSGRLGRPEEIAEAVIWLCSEAASFVAGHALSIDGGMTID
ncbi:glucose 1-dehydrogenase [Novosphingobium sp. JCM 18896]|uniref:glucose 1-dehydrogenase n=1 Tax=Novosphingobium sp. JCM 18896 TaxID=2989731 RepID=UPI0022222C27|nr:glucose 1-dehydrogenase [Novosphingobium sp. JCM 18896]MCW1431720.1 SDR family oxidoreductase [Novosphingobium sp. JCM 18896]